MLCSQPVSSWEAVSCLATRPTHSLQEGTAAGFLDLAGLTCLFPLSPPG